MPKNFSFAPKLKLKVTVRDPRVLMRALIGVLVAANLAAAIVAFKPFGGSADDLRREQESLSRKLSQAQTRLQFSKHMTEKVQTARSQGDDFLTKYFMDEPTTSAEILNELTTSATTAGIKMGQAQFSREEIEGSDSMFMLSMTVGFEGTYANLTKFVNLLDKSPRFLIIENMTAAAPQQQGGPPPGPGRA